MRFLIIGAGGIGCYYAAKLLQAEHEVTLVARGQHLDALQTGGLRVDHEDFTLQQSVTAFDQSSLMAQHPASEYDLIILCVKAQATTAWLDETSAWLRESETPVLSLQNGVDNEPAIANTIGNDRTFGGLAVRIGGHIQAPGHVVASGPAQIVMGLWPESSTDNPHQAQLDAAYQAFQSAGIPTRVSDHVAVELWRKLMINNGVNPLSALTRLDTQSLCHHPGYRPAIRALMQETAQAAAADNVRLGEDDVNEMLDLISNFNAIKTSMLVDLEKGRPLELEGICGAVIKRGEQLGIDTPVSRLVNALLQPQH